MTKLGWLNSYVYFIAGGGFGLSFGSSALGEGCASGRPLRLSCAQIARQNALINSRHPRDLSTTFIFVDKHSVDAPGRMQVGYCQKPDRQRGCFSQIAEPTVEYVWRGALPHGRASDTTVIRISRRLVSRRRLLPW